MIGDTATGKPMSAEISFFPQNAYLVMHHAETIPKIEFITIAQTVVLSVNMAALIAYGSVIDPQ